MKLLKRIAVAIIILMFLVIAFVIWAVESDDKPRASAITTENTVNIEQSQPKHGESIAQVRTAEPPKADNQSREKAKQYFLGNDEPTVKDATWTSDYMFKVGVVDDGTPRHGFANYVCEVLRSDFNIKDKQLMVEVIDIEKLVSTNKWVELGKATCK